MDSYSYTYGMSKKKVFQLHSSVVQLSFLALEKPIEKINLTPKSI